MSENWVAMPVSEASEPNDGLFSHVGEWHPFVVGFGAGYAVGSKEWALLGIVGAAISPPVLAQARRESWYVVAGVLIGYMVGRVAP